MIAKDLVKKKKCDAHVSSGSSISTKKQRRAREKEKKSYIYIYMYVHRVPAGKRISFCPEKREKVDPAAAATRPI